MTYDRASALGTDGRPKHPLVGHTTIYKSKPSGVAVQVGGPNGSTAGLTVKF